MGKVNEEGEELRNRFCVAFFSISRIASLRKEILDFRQDEKESIGAAWARFSKLTHAGPNLSIPDHVLLQHFWVGLSKESAQQLDITAGGAFMCKTTSEGEALLDRILKNTSFTETLPLVEPSSCEEVPLIESASSPLNNPDSTTEPFPELGTLGDEEIQPSVVPFEFEDDLFEDYGNTSNYLYQKRPPVPVGPTEPLDKAFLKETVRDLTAVMSSEWVEEGELSSEPLQIIAPSLNIHCFIQ